MPLRGSTPKETDPRLKLLLSGPAGVGKTTAAIQMPRPYIIDPENGCAHYGPEIAKAGGAVFASADPSEVHREVRALLEEQHDYLTLVIDPATVIFDRAMDEGVRKVGDSYGKHREYAKSYMRRLFALLTEIDMNVVVTAHQKVHYEMVEQTDGKMERTATGMTFDGYDKMDYDFDLYIQLRRVRGEPTRRQAAVIKTRFREFPDGDVFDWTYDVLVERFGKDRLEATSTPKKLATPEQIETFTGLVRRLDESDLRSLRMLQLSKRLDTLDLMPSDQLDRGITKIREYLAAEAQGTQE